jgi:hypothetical protein
MNLRPSGGLEIKNFDQVMSIIGKRTGEEEMLARFLHYLYTRGTVVPHMKTVQNYDTNIRLFA